MTDLWNSYHGGIGRFNSNFALQLLALYEYVSGTTYIGKTFGIS